MTGQINIMDFVFPIFFSFSTQSSEEINKIKAISMNPHTKSRFSLLDCKFYCFYPLALFLQSNTKIHLIHWNEKLRYCTYNFFYQLGKFSSVFVFVTLTCYVPDFCEVP
ncbi:hypothetical protein CHARACLAT_012679 [Characodon lateralis]|uniref:Uncharacterized protein n=1 Tax=Characodon lateralis TaxID=208331 RepID=A0ABU7F5Q0_9TELE|nr:hypothetical protein [Characodon lateralis]